MKPCFLALIIAGLCICVIPSCESSTKEESKETVAPKKNSKPYTPKPKKSKSTAKKASGSQFNQAKKFIERNGFSTEYCFMVDMSIHSGKNRFFVYDLEKQTIALSGLVAHGSCNTQYLSRARFSNTPDCGCSSLGRYKIGKPYIGQYGRSYQLHGLDRSNSNALKRAVVLHGYNCVPDREIYPMVLCNSLGCPMVSEAFFRKLSRIIDRSDKPILLWVYK